MNTSERIKQLRKSTGLSQTKFGELFGIPMRTIQNWESGEREPAEYIVNMMERIAEFEDTESDTERTE